MMNKERYHHNAHTLTDLKYHFIWKTKYGYYVLNGEIALRIKDIFKNICVEKRLRIIHMLVESPTTGPSSTFG